MSFLGHSPTNYSAGTKPQPKGSARDFTMFGSGGSESGSVFGGADDKSGPSAGEGGASFFESGEFGTPSKSEDQKPPTSFFGPPPDTTSSSAGPTNQQTKHPAGPSPISLIARAPPAARPGVTKDCKSQGYGQFQAQDENQADPQSQMYKQSPTGVTMTPTKPQEFRLAQPQGYNPPPSQEQKKHASAPARDVASFQGKEHGPVKKKKNKSGSKRRDKFRNLEMLERLERPGMLETSRII